MLGNNVKNEEIHSKGFSMYRSEWNPSLSRRDSVKETIEFNKVKVGVKTLDDAVLNLNALKTYSSEIVDKEKIVQALARKNYDSLRITSNTFFELSGIYKRVCKYMANIYRWDWMVTPYIIDKTKADNAKITRDFNNLLWYFDTTDFKSLFNEIALKVVKNGCYYGYKVDVGDRFMLQELPIEYCRSRYFVAGKPAVEFNLKFFDDKFPDSKYKAKVLKMFPPEFGKAYGLYQKSKLQPDFNGDDRGWYLLDPDCSVKFNIDNNDCPIMVSMIPYLIDLDEAQALDRKKMMQKLLKIVIQKLPLDKNGDLVFDVDEATDLHNNAVLMLKKAIGVDVLTTFGEIKVEDLSDSATTAATDELEKVERAVYNEAGVSSSLFNTDGNLALEKSILNDEAAMSGLRLSFQRLMNDVLVIFNRNKNVRFKCELLATTCYNYKDLSDKYKGLVQLGYSKMLPMICLGHSQSQILSSAYFENDVLSLAELMTPPQMSSTMSGSSSKTDITSDGKVGRKAKADDQKSDKTIANKEAMN